jgi:hypothetical protein
LHSLLWGLLWQRLDSPDGPGLASGPVWRVMRAAARLMPPAAGQRWLEEAESFLAEAPAGLSRAALRSYLLSVPQVTVITWSAAGYRWAQLAVRKVVAK